MNAFETALCSAFCGGIQVHPVPSGYAVSTAFEDASGDRITFYVSEVEDGFVLEDDGDYLATLAARDIPFQDGSRGKLLDAILAEGGAFWDRDTFEIKTGAIEEAGLASRSIAFLSSLIRVRDLGLLTRDRIKSAFREDVLAALEARLPDTISIEENVAPSSEYRDLPADIVLREKAGHRSTSIYLASTSDKLTEALLAWHDYGERDPNMAVVALLEDMDFRNISKFKYQRALNRGVPIAAFRGDEGTAIERIAKEMHVTLQ
jgi:hypothetical protein